ncbi:MAG: extracellular solute-binding protein [Oscillospiraceae bacterium]|nr:extracellular solute-binding protein [Oscillospiraceae bacterium]
MKKIKFSVFCIFLALAILPILALSACNSGESGAPENTEAQKDIADATDAETDDPENAPYMGYVFPEVDFGGYEFVISSLIFDGAVNEIVMEKEDGNVINDAIYKRNLIIEEQFNITIKNTQFPNGQMQDVITRSAAAGDNAFDLAFCNTTESAAIAGRGIFVDLFDIESLSMRSPWWNQNFIDNVSVGGKLYFCLSDIAVQPNQLAWALCFNKTIMKDLELSEPYTLVREGTWTIDAMLGLMKQGSHDLNGDGTFSKGDRFGFIGNDSASNGFLNGADINPIIKDEDDYPILNPPSEKDNLAADKLKELFDLPSGNSLRVAQGDECVLFMQGEALFISNNMTMIDRIRDMDDDFGIVPYPKLDASQEAYHSVMGTNAMSFGIPSSAEDIERIGTITCAMTAVSMDTVRPAYFESTLKRKRARDDESLDMLEIIAATRIVDVGLIFGWGGFATAYRDNVVQQKSESLFTVFEKNAGSAQAAIDKSLKTFAELE